MEVNYFLVTFWKRNWGSGVKVGVDTGLAHVWVSNGGKFVFIH